MKVPLPTILCPLCVLKALTIRLIKECSYKMVESDVKRNVITPDCPPKDTLKYHIKLCEKEIFLTVYLV